MQASSFAYRAARRDGTLTTGTVSAVSESDALRQLRAQGLMPVKLQRAAPGAGNASSTASVRPAARPASRPRAGQSAASRQVPATRGAAEAGRAARSRLFEGEKRVDRRDVLAMTSELGVLLKAGLPIDQAIKVQQEMSAKPAYTRLLASLLETVKAGRSLSHGLEQHPELFSGFYVNMVKSGEAGGQLASVMQRLAEHLARSREVRATVVSALIYPAILAAVAVISVAVMLGFVVPQFEALFADMGDGLPGLTRAVIALGDVVRAYGWLLILLGAGLWFAARSWLQRPEGKSWLDRRALALPLVGELVFQYNMALFARTLGTLFGNGVTLLQALDIALTTVGNAVVRRELEALPAAVKGGKRISETLLAAGAFSPMVVQMVRVGEESGRLDEMLLELARSYESDVEAGVKRSLTLLEPLLILGMGGLIAVIIISILMGILSVNDLAM